MELRPLRELERLLPGKVFTDEDKLLAYSYDASNLTGRPWAVVLPERKEEVLEVLKFADLFDLPIVTRGSGTSTTGSSVPLQGGIVLSLSKLNRIVEFNLEEQTLCCEPGVLTGDLKRYVARYNFFYPPDPSSYEFSTIGGNVATGAGGPRGLKYGTTKDYVLALKVGLPGGKLIRTGPPTLKKSSFYNLTPLFVGSEGTLGVILEIMLRLIPKPEMRALFLVKAREELSLLMLIEEVLKAGVIPSATEFVDQTSTRALHLRGTDCLSSEHRAILFLELDGKACCVREEVKVVEKLLRGDQLEYEFSSEEAQIEPLWEIRRSLSPSLRVLGPMKLSDDVTIPRRHNLRFLQFLRDLERGTKVAISAFGHVGDGNFHVNLYFDEESADTAKALRERIIEKVLELAGTVSGEHGIGFTKKSYFARELTEAELSLMRGLKALFDPKNLLNPDVKIP